MHDHTIKGNEETEEPSFAQKKIRQFLMKLGVPQSAKPTYAQAKKIFVTAVCDYEKGEFDEGQLVGIGSLLWYDLSNMEKASAELGELLFALIESDCPFCNPSGKLDLQKVMTYYERNKIHVIGTEKTGMRV